MPKVEERYVGVCVESEVVKRRSGFVIRCVEKKGKVGD
jgi:hypothetical protein